MTRRHGIIAALIIFGTATVAVASLRRAQPGPDQRPPVPIRTVPVEGERYAVPIVATGTLAAEAETPLAFKIGGVVSRIAVQVGDNVRAGQLLAAVDPGEIDASVAKARAALAKADRDLARATALYRDSVISLDRLQDATTARSVAAADADLAAFNRRYAEIRSPAAGTIQRRLAEPGQTVAPGAPVVVVAVRGGQAVIRAGLADRDAARLSLGDPAEVRFAIAPESPVPARVTRLAPAPTAGAGTYQAEVTVAAPVSWPNDGVVAGLVAQVVIRPSRTTAGTRIPLAALLEADGDSATVFVIDPATGRAARRVVRIAALAGDRAVIRSGLEGIREVVSDGAAFLSPGAAVAVAREPR